MKIKILFCFCLVLLFTGCHEMYTVHYVYRNGTDKSLEVVAYDITDNAQGSAVEIQYRFSLVPDGARLQFMFPGIAIFFLFGQSIMSNCRMTSRRLFLQRLVISMV